jgi:hypothetical protein
MRMGHPLAGSPSAPYPPGSISERGLRTVDVWRRALQRGIDGMLASLKNEAAPNPQEPQPMLRLLDGQACG